MFQILVITLRECIEAFLIVAITVAYLRKTGRSALLPPAYWGTATAIVLSIILGVALAEVAVQPLWEGVLAAVAAALVLGMVVYMLRAAKHLRATINSRIEASGAAARHRCMARRVLVRAADDHARRHGDRVHRQCACTEDRLRCHAVRRAIGIGLAALVAWAWSRYGHRVRLDLFFQVTSIFLLLFVVQLLIYSFHELSEANVLPIDNEFWHEATEPYGPDGVYGQWLSAGLVLVPLAWLAWSWLKGRRRRRSRRLSAPPRLAAFGPFERFQKSRAGYSLPRPRVARAPAAAAGAIQDAPDWPDCKNRLPSCALRDARRVARSVRASPARIPPRAPVMQSRTPCAIHTQTPAPPQQD